MLNASRDRTILGLHNQTKGRQPQTKLDDPPAETELGGIYQHNEAAEGTQQR